MAEDDVFTFRDTKPTPDMYHVYDDSQKGNNAPALVLDHGSYHCRVGWAVDPNPKLTFRNLMAKLRKEKGKSDVEVLVGNDIANFEAVRFQLKSPFDRDVITQIDTVETVFDYAFSHLGIDTEGSINHPIVLTEAVCNPSPARQFMNELLFECYQVPAVSVGIDALFSLQHNFSKPCVDLPTSLVVRLGYQTTHILPVIGGKCDPQGIRRINLGGLQMISYLHRLLQLKYPSHLSSVTFSRAEELIHDYGYIAEDYLEELSKWADGDFYDSNVRKIQLPFTPAPTAAETSLNLEQQQQRRKENVKRLVEINAKKREERLALDEERLETLQIIQHQLAEVDDALAVKLLRQAEITDEHHLEQEIQNIQDRVSRTRQKMAAAAANLNEEGEPKKPTETAEFQEWLEGIRKQRTEILSRRRERQQRRQELTKRKSAAAQERMRILSMLAKSGGTGPGKKKEDTFGMKDEDWDIYKAVSKDGGGSDSEAEQEKLNDLESALKRYDPNFKNYSGASSNVGEGGSGGFVPTAEFYQLHIGTERIRAPELFFQPSFIGSHQAGVSETIGYVVKLYDSETQLRLVNNVFVTGGCANIPGLLPRLKKDLLSMRPFESAFNVNIAADPAGDAWKGARDFARVAPPSAFLSRSEYQEYGPHYFAEHHASNRRFALTKQ
ncbi:actin-related protein 5 [Daphnia magna]|uniref:actin-related protein 5 n=1 Tax=Daphnia magna TaxID=35525 RepID=UPI0006DEE8E2|nr:actin-related protein 5 [Daphnia magna]